MADLDGAGSATVADGSGFLGRRARQQYAALVQMRTRLFANVIRSNEGAFEFSARAVSFLIYCFIGVSLGVGAGAAAYSFVSSREWAFLSVEFWVVAFLWQAISVMLASFQEQFDVTGLLRFPVSFGSFVLLYLIFGLIDIPTIVGGLCALGIFVGAAIARPEVVGWTALVLACFAAFNMLLARAILAWLDRWLAKRRSREIMSAVFLLGVLSLQVLNPAFRKLEDDRMPSASEAHHVQLNVRPIINVAETVQAWLPPGLAAVGLRRAGAREVAAALGAIGLLGVYAVGAAALLASRLRAEYHGESLGEAPNRQRAAIREAGWLFRGGPMAAVIEKELRTLTRSVPQLYALIVPMLMVFIIGNVFNATSGTRHSLQIAFPVCVAYGLLGFIQLIYNSLGPEGSAIQLLLLSPTPMRTVLLAKNLCHAALFAMVAMGSALLASVRLGRPGPAILATTAAWLAFALPANLAAGDIMSLMMPYRVNLGRLGRQAGSQANALLSMLIQASLLGIGAVVISLSTFLGSTWTAAIVLTLLAVVAWIGWSIVLSKTDGIAASRREQLIARLAKTA